MAKISCNIDAFRHSDKPYQYAFKVLSELGFDAVEPEALDGRCIYTIYHFCPMISLEDDPLEVKKLASDYGLEISCLSAHTSLLNTEYGTRYLRRAIKFADKLGAPIVNTSEGPKPPGMSDDDAFNLIKYTLDETLKVAKNYGIKVTVEPHGEYTTNIQGLRKILSLVDSEWLGVNFDTGNVYLSGNDPVQTLKGVVEKVIYVHVKDVGGALLEERGKVTGTPVGVAVGRGNVDIKGCVSALKEAGYDGVYSIEAAEKDLKESLQYLRAIV
ncbi:TPA: sugar phosphate isomerase/epimerase [Candidatus Bathyarchaeota archaeon]|nr:sugar phosphate isomerase/epimerase [Candidatus Bathyarchaeota archaeon]